MRCPPRTILPAAGNPLAPGCPEPRPIRPCWSWFETARCEVTSSRESGPRRATHTAVVIFRVFTDVRISVLTVIPRRITAGTLTITRLPQRGPNRHAISQRAILRLTSTVDYDSSLKNDHYWPNLQGAGQTSFAPKTSLNLQPISNFISPIW